MTRQRLMNHEKLHQQDWKDLDNDARTQSLTNFLSLTDFFNSMSDPRQQSFQSADDPVARHSRIRPEMDRMMFNVESLPKITAQTGRCQGRESNLVIVRLLTGATLDLLATKRKQTAPDSNVIL
jgi:hypothetical protein